MRWSASSTSFVADIQPRGSKILASMAATIGSEAPDPSPPCIPLVKEDESSCAADQDCVEGTSRLVEALALSGIGPDAEGLAHPVGHRLQSSGRT